LLSCFWIDNRKRPITLVANKEEIRFPARADRQPARERRDEKKEHRFGFHIQVYNRFLFTDKMLMQWKYLADFLRKRAHLPNL
jgi:hypothetical protein